MKEKKIYLYLNSRLQFKEAKLRVNSCKLLHHKIMKGRPLKRPSNSCSLLYSYKARKWLTEGHKEGCNTKTLSCFPSILALLSCTDNWEAEKQTNHKRMHLTIYTERVLECHCKLRTELYANDCTVTLWKEGCCHFWIFSNPPTPPPYTPTLPSLQALIHSYSPTGHNTLLEQIRQIGKQH